MSADKYDHINRKLRTLQQCVLYRRTITLICLACRRQRRLDVPLWYLFERRGWDDHLPGAYRRLYCTDCAKSSGRIVRPLAAITRDTPDVDQLPYPDKRTWRQLVSRYRS